MIEKPLAFLSLIRTLEAAVGRKTGYSQLEPFPCTTVSEGQPAIIQIQKAAKTIAQHVRLADLTFIISVTTQAPSTAGHIELRYGQPEVFVELSRDICGFKDAVLATLCHEIAHKFLHVYGIRNGVTQIEQEFLTDAATVYLGMGKIMLNGCECQHSYTKTEGGRTTTTTHTVRTGYISRECFAFVYRLVCEMRQIPAEQYLRGLSEAARQAIEACEREYGDWFVPRFHTPEGIQELSEELRGRILGRQAEVAERDYTLRKATRRLDAAGSALRSSHEPLVDAGRTVGDLLKANDNPHLKYLDCIETREIVADSVRASKGRAEGLVPGWPRINALAEVVEGPESESEIVECPIDRTRLRVPSGRRQLLVTCSVCKYSFVVTTMAEDRRLSVPSPPKHRKPGFLQRVKAAFGRR